MKIAEEEYKRHANGEPLKNGKYNPWYYNGFRKVSLTVENTDPSRVEEIAVIKRFDPKRSKAIN